MNGNCGTRGLALSPSCGPNPMVAGGMEADPKAAAPTKFVRVGLLLFALWVIASTGVAGAASSRLDYPNPFENRLGEPLGGGVGFRSFVDGYEVSDLVGNRSELLKALKAVHSFRRKRIGLPVIYIKDDAEIDLTGISLQITRPLILASGRGRDGSLGALLYVRNVAEPLGQDNKSLLAVKSDDVYLSGLRIRGPHMRTDHSDEEGWFYGVSAGAKATRRADAVAAHRFRIENCEVWGWSAAAVSLTNSHDAVISHNHIHHNQRESVGGSQGYGVKLAGDARALIRANVFDYVRHAVAGTGEAGQAYEAAYNFAGSHATSTTFDIHGACEGGHSTPSASGLRCDDPGGQLAGSFVRIYHNIVLQDSHPAVNIRGRTAGRSVVQGNYFAHDSEQNAVLQREIHCNNVDCSLTYLTTLDEYSNLRVSGNILQFRFAGRWVSWGAESSWFPISKEARASTEVAVGDFDGDGVDDLFRATGSEWLVSGAGRDEWTHLNYSSNHLEHLAFRDFDGNGMTDVFKSHAGQWKVSLEGWKRWRRLNTSRRPLHELRFGHFNDNDTTDVIRFDPPHCRIWDRHGHGCVAYATRAEISFEGTDKWEPLWTYSGRVRSSDVAVGDFDGDGIDDLLHTTGSGWYVSWDGRSDFSFCKRSRYRASAFRVADFDGDGRSDVLANGSSGSGVWNISHAAFGSWEKHNASSFDVRDLEVGDFDGDGRADLLRR